MRTHVQKKLTKRKTTNEIRRSPGKNKNDGTVTVVHMETIDNSRLHGDKLVVTTHSERTNKLETQTMRLLYLYSYDINLAFLRLPSC